MSKYTFQERAEQYRKLALRNDEGKRAREAYAQTLGVPILQEVKAQSSIMSIFTPIELDPNERCEAQVELSTAPSTNRFTGAPTTPLLVYNSPGVGPTLAQVLQSKTIDIPTGPFDTASGYPVYAAERALFSFEEAHRRRLANAIKDNIEDNGWATIQAVVSNVAFPAAQTVEIAAGQPGVSYFSIQLFSKLVRLTLDVGLITEGNYTPTIWVSNQSFEDYLNWGINSQFDTSTPAQIPESLKDQLAQIAGVANVGVYRGIPIVSLRRLQTSDITASKDYCYLLLKSTIPNGYILPIRTIAEQSAVTGLEEYFPMRVLDNPTSVYERNEIEQKVRWDCGFACLDARTAYTGIVDRS